MNALLLVMPLLAGPGWSADTLDDCGPAQVRAYLALAEACERAYDDSQPGLDKTPSGCVALVAENADGNLIIAFRGSMLGDRNPKHRFSNLGGANIRRNYRDWVATNVKQAAGFLPRQYAEAASLVRGYARTHPVDKLIYVTGHSKGGGAATYAYVAARVSPDVSREQAQRLRCVTFNAAVIKEQNWRRLFRRLERGVAASEKALATGSIHALVMADDPVSNLAASEERRYVRRIVIAPSTDLTATEQHGIGVVIEELQRRLGQYR